MFRCCGKGFRLRKVVLNQECATEVHDEIFKNEQHKWRGCVHVCVCVCVRERERDRERERQRQREREREREGERHREGKKEAQLQKI
jgi:hypothetical protein